MFKILKTIMGNSLFFVFNIILYSFLEAIFTFIPYFLLIFLIPNILFDIKNNDFSLITFMLFGAMMCFYVIELLFSFKSKRLASKYGYEAGNSIRLATIKEIEALKMDYFKTRDSGEIQNRISSNIQTIEMMLSHFFAQTIINISIPLFALIVVFFIEPVIGFIMLFSFLLAFVFLFISLKMLGIDGLKRVKKQDLLNSSFLDYVRGIEIFKTFNLTGKKFRELKNALKDMGNFNYNIEIRSFAFSLTYSAILEIGFMLIIGFIFTNPYVSQKFGIFIAIIIICMQYFKYLHKLAESASLSRVALAATLAINEIFELSDQKKYVAKNLEAYDIEFKNVCFNYKNKNTLKNVSFKVREKSLSAIVGSSGAGKSTILYLISNFFDIQSGEIYIGKTNIKDIAPQKLLQNISTVFQDVYLFNDSILENIKIGKKSATKEEVKNAARLARCDNFISSLRDGYETMISEGGKNLSGGQKQRISIARAFLKDAPIVLLDEITSSLDEQNDTQINQAIKNLTKNKTVIMITHKIESIKNVDQIIFLNDGKISQIGKYEELMKENSPFFQWQSYKEKNEIHI